MTFNMNKREDSTLKLTQRQLEVPSLLHESRHRAVLVRKQQLLQLDNFRFQKRNLILDNINSQHTLEHSRT